MKYNDHSRLLIPIIAASFPETILKKLLSSEQFELICHIDGCRCLSQISSLVSRSMEQVLVELRQLAALDIIQLREVSSPPPPEELVPCEGGSQGGESASVVYRASEPSSSSRAEARAKVDNSTVIVGKVIDPVAGGVVERHPSFAPPASVSKASLDALAELSFLEANPSEWGASDSALRAQVEQDYQEEWTYSDVTNSQGLPPQDLSLPWTPHDPSPPTYSLRPMEPHKQSSQSEPSPLVASAPPSATPAPLVASAPPPSATPAPPSATPAPPSATPAPPSPSPLQALVSPVASASAKASASATSSASAKASASVGIELATSSRRAGEAEVWNTADLRSLAFGAYAYEPEPLAGQEQEEARSRAVPPPPSRDPASVWLSASTSDLPIGTFPSDFSIGELPSANTPSRLPRRTSEQDSEVQPRNELSRERAAKASEALPPRTPAQARATSSQDMKKEPWHRRWLFLDAASRVALPSAHTWKRNTGDTSGELPPVK